MTYFTFNNIKIVGVAAAVPKQKVKIDDFTNQFGEETIKKYKIMTGIEEFRKSSDKQTASDLGFAAAENLINKLNILREEIDGLIFVSQSHDYKRPATAYVLHKRLNLNENCAVFDINLGCSGFVYGFQILASVMNSSNMRKAMLIVAETSTKVMWPNDKSVSMLFGDSGSAVLLEKVNDAGNDIKGCLYSKGQYFKSIIIPAGGFRMPDADKNIFIGSDGNEHSLYYQYMNGLDIMQFSITDVPKSIKEYLNYYKIDINRFDYYILHQANAFIIKQLIKRFKLSKDKVPMVLNKYGNIGGVSIPLVLCDLLGMNNNGRNYSMFSCGFGIGLSWGILDFAINEDVVLPVIETDDFYQEGIITKEMI